MTEQVKKDGASNSDCRKCKAPMPPMKSSSFGRLGAMFPTFNVTAYRCEECGHWNDLKRRKSKNAAELGKAKP